MSRPKKPSTQVEIVPAFDTPELIELGTGIAEVIGEIGTKTARFHDELIYIIVRAGVLFLQAKERVGHGYFGDFLAKSATVADLKISERSAQNYMRAAENAGLSASSTERDIEALRSCRALHGKKPTELYRLPAAPPTDDPGGQMQLDLVTEVLQAVEKDCDQAIIVKDRMSAKQYEACWRRLKLTLEALTDSPWDMVDRETGLPASERGDNRGRKRRG
ncbi:MAG: hypothetical protein PHE83_05745 [Opitutaceae bacterium]|nr:hypothetical protein [Opitutaceae bacterium]